MTKRLAIGLAALCLLMCAGCSQKIQQQKVMPPAAFMTEVPEPEFVGTRNLDLLQWAFDLRVSLAKANINIRSIREWCQMNGEPAETEK